LKFKKIIIYNEVSIPEIRISEITNFLKDNFKVDIIIKNSFFQELDKDEIKSLSKIRIFNIYKKYTPCDPEQKSITFEEKLCNDSSIMEQTTKIEYAKDISDIVMYDGFEMQKILREKINCITNDTLYIIFTNRLTCTYDDSDYRYHGRASIIPVVDKIAGFAHITARPWYL
jgi:hypothetical protein